MDARAAAGAWLTVRSGRSRLLPVSLSILLALSMSPVVMVPLASAATLPTSFTEQTVFSGLINPTVVRFAVDGRVFVAEKRGIIKVYDSLTDPTPTQFADLRRNVYNFWDRGMLGMALAPNFPADPWVYVLYAHDAEIGGQAPKYGNPPPAAPTDGDPCGDPTGDGCVVSGRLSRLQAAGNVMVGPEQVLIEDWCQQYPSHSTGSVEFAADGSLYVSAGDGASFTFTDYGQDGSPLNPCNDPGSGSPLSPPTAEGGALRSQDLRTSGDPVSLDGAILRVDPATGAGVAGNPLFANPDPNAQRIIGYGTRNPFRMIVRPGTNEAWFGDVGYNTWEEINRLAQPAAPLENFGWPCYEGSARQPAYDSANLSICENLYAAGAGAVVAPYFSYSHSAKVVTGETCSSGSSSVEAGAFYEGGDYPSTYADAFFFADYSRDCIWVMPVGTNGLPNVAARATFAAGDITQTGCELCPVDLEIGPGGDLFYVDFDHGAIRRINYTDPSGNQPPTAQVVANPTSGSAPLAVALSGSSSTDPDPGTTLSYAWDLDNDGAFDDATTATTSRNFSTAGVYQVRLKVDDGDGAFDVDTETILVDAHAPTAVIDTPNTGTTWRVGDVINFSGHATDAEQGTLPASALDWSLVMHHCPSNCHTHVMQTFDNMAGGSFTTPDHDYPSFIELKLTATDSTGLTHTVSRQLDPQTVNLTFTTNPSGLQVVVGPSAHTAPTTQTVIVGSTNSISAPSPQTVGDETHTFISWSDGGAESHDIVAPATATTYTATYTGADPGAVTFNPTDDARVVESSPGSNKGSDLELRVKDQAGGDHRSYLKFTVTGLTAAPASVKLRLWVTDGSPDGGTAYDVSDAWGESTITWSNAPTVGGTPLGVFGSVATNTWAEVDLTSYVTGNGTYSLAIQNSHSNVAIYSSSEGANAPQLVISNTVTPGPVTPIDDARVVEQNPTTNKGSDVTLRVKQQAGAAHRSYLKFVVSGLTGAPSSVRLRLWVTDASPSGGSVYDVADAWSESTITWSNAPPIGGPVLAGFGTVVLNTWAEVDLTSYVTANGTYSIAIQSTSTNAAIYSSAEGANPPQLVITP